MPLEPQGLATAFETAMAKAWQELKNQPLPGDPNERKPLFLGIAAGLLTYLQQHQSDMLSQMDVSIEGATSVTETVSNLQLNITGI